MEISSARRIRPRCSSNTKNLIDLPVDTLFDILSRLPVKSVCCIKCVSKTLLNVVRRPSFVNVHMHHLITTGSAAASEVPQLMIVAWSHTKYTSEFMALQSLEYDGNTLKKSKHTIVSKIEFRRDEYYLYPQFVFCNLLCYEDRKDEGRCLLLNPFNGEVLMLPKIPQPKSLFKYWHGMGFDSVTNAHKIVCVCWDVKNNYMESYVHVLGTSSWKAIHSVPTCDLSDKKNVTAYGEMHWLVCRSSYDISILSFDFKKEEFYWTPRPTLRKMPRRSIPLDRFHLINLRGYLSVVDASSDKYLEIWLLKNYDKRVDAML